MVTESTASSPSAAGAWNDTEGCSSLSRMLKVCTAMSATACCRSPRVIMTVSSCSSSTSSSTVMPMVSVVIPAGRVMVPSTRSKSIPPGLAVPVTV